MNIKYSFIAAVFLLYAQNLSAQNETHGSLKGRLADTTVHQVLKQATISILNSKDSSLIMYGLTDDKGLFSLKNIPFGNYILQIAFSGYGTRYKPFRITKDSAALDAGIIY